MALRFASTPVTRRLGVGLLVVALLGGCAQDVETSERRTEAPDPVHAVDQADSSPEAVVARQLEAYNAHDLEGFMATFHAQAELFVLGESEPRTRGKAAVRELYGGLFDDSPELHSELVHRAVIGSRVIDHERITGRAGSDGVLELVMIYEVQDGAIRRAWSIRP